MTYSADENHTIPLWLKITLGIIALIIFLLLSLIIYKYSASLTDGFIPDYPDRDEWGVFGDFFGGVLNPAFGFASFIALLATIFYQAKELNASTKELRNSATALAAQNKAIDLQSFEQTFFSWVSTYRELLNSVTKINNVGQPFKGIEGLYKIWSENLDSGSIYSSLCQYDDSSMSVILKPQFIGEYDVNFNKFSNYKKIEFIAESKKELIAIHIHQIWCELYRKQEYQLDSLFRSAYRLINWIDTQPQEKLNDNQKWLYISIFRSQLSWIEMVFFYYNGLTGSGKKFKKLIEKYALFDNLTCDSDVGIKVMSKYFSKDEFYMATAFDTDKAKELN